VSRLESLEAMRCDMGRTKETCARSVYRPNAHPSDSIPRDWSNDILRRVPFNPDPMTKMDRSLRA
jgi:hypothetical protein